MAYDAGIHNSDLEATRTRLLKGNSYADCSCGVITPTRGFIHARIVQCHKALIAPANQKFTWIYLVGLEVGDAYSQAVEMVLSNPELSTWKYLAFVEDDNAPPPDGLLKLIESLEGGVDGIKYDGISGLYFCKGPGGCSQIWGDINDPVENYRPQIPIVDSVQPCYGIGNGFALFRLSMFKDVRWEKPFFKTAQEYIPGIGSKGSTQDLYMCHKARALGYKFAVDTRVRVGHYDSGTDQMW